MQTGALSGKPPRGAWQMVGLAFAAQNFAIGLSIASFGVVVLSIEQLFHTNRTLASLGASLVILSFGIFAPLATRLIEMWSIRKTMIFGIILGSTGYVALAIAPNIWVFLVAYGLLVGPGALCAGHLPGSILVNNWFSHARGRALGVMMIPFGVMLVPLLCTPILESVGLRALYLVMSGVNLLMLPLLMFVRDRPPVAPAPLAGAGRDTIVAPTDIIVMRPLEILCRADFWLLMVAVGLLNGSSMIKVTHLVALVSEQGFTLGQATILLSVSGGAGAVGSLLFGWLADRVGAAGALLVNGLAQAAAWAIFFLHPGIPLLITDAIIMGIAGSGVFAATVVGLSQLFGSQNMTRTMGLSGFFGIFPNFMSPPLAGLLRQISGSYTLVLLAVIGACLVATISMAVLMARRHLVGRHGRLILDS